MFPGSLTLRDPPKQLPKKSASSHIKNPSFRKRPSSSEPKDTNEDEEKLVGSGDEGREGGSDSGEQNSTGGGEEGSAGSMDMGEGNEGNAAEGDYPGEQNDDHGFESGDLCIDDTTATSDKSQEEEGNEDSCNVNEEEEEKKEQDEKKEDDKYDPEQATVSDDEADKGKKSDDLYDPLEATADSESEKAESPKPNAEELYDPMEVTQSDDEQEQQDNVKETGAEEEKSEEFYDPEAATSDQENDDDANNASSPKDSDDMTNKPTNDDESADQDNSPQSPKEEEETDMYNPEEPVDDTESDNAKDEVVQLDNDSEEHVKNDRADGAVDPEEQVSGESAAAGIASPADESDDSEDCPTPVADENGPESPDPETQNPENFSFSALGGNSSQNGEHSDETTPLGTPCQTNDVTPNLSPITDSEIPLTKHGAATPEIESKVSPSSSPAQQDGDWEKTERTMTDSEEEEFQRRFMPVSELPRIPKKKQPPPEVIVIDDEDSPEEAHKSVLEKVNVRDDSYKWEGKGSRRDRSRDRRRRDSDGSEERYSSRRRRHRDEDSDDERRDKKRKHKRRSRSRSGGRSRDRERSRRSRSRSRDRRRSRRGRSKSRSRDRKRTRSRERKRRARSRTPKRKRDRDRDREKKRKDRDRRSGSRDKFGRSAPSEFKASIKTFTQTLKEAANPDSGRKFKLKRNFYNEVIDGDRSGEDVPLPSDPPPTKKKQKNTKSKKEREREEKGGWRTPSPVSKRTSSPSNNKIETVITSTRQSFNRSKDQTFERNPAFNSSSSSEAEDEPNNQDIKIPPSNNISIRTDKSPPRLYSNYDPSDPTEEAASPPIPPDEDKRTPPPIPGLGSPHNAGPPPPGAELLTQQQNLFAANPLMDPMRPNAGMDMQPAFINPENPIRPGTAAPGMMIRTPLGLVPAGPGLVNPLLGPPPPFNAQFPPPRFPAGQPPSTAGGRLAAPGFIQLPTGQRLPVNQNGLPLQGDAAAGNAVAAGGPPPPLMLDGLPPGMRPVLPDTRLPPPNAAPSSSNANSSAGANQSGLPAKALEQMQQISNLLNAQAKLAQFAPGKSGNKGEAGDKQSTSSLLGAPPSGLKPMSSSGGKPQLQTQSTGPFKVPMPPPPLNNSTNKDKKSDSKKGARKAEETTEVVDMDVASPYSDDEVGINISFSPPLKKRSRQSRADRDENRKSKTSDMDKKIEEVFGKRADNSSKDKDKQSKKKKEKSVSVKFNLEKKPSALVKPSKASVNPSVNKDNKGSKADGGSDDVPTSAVELDKQQKVSRRSQVGANTHPPSSMGRGVFIHSLCVNVVSSWDKGSLRLNFCTCLCVC